MNQTRAKWIISGVLLFVLTAVIALVVAKLTGRNASEKEPTKAVVPEVPEGSVLLWLRTEVRQTLSGIDAEFLTTYTYDELGRCTEILQPYYREQYVYDNAAHTTERIMTEDYQICHRVYNSDGKLLREYTQRKDDDGKWYTSAETTVNYVSLESGVVLEETRETRFNDDGTVSYKSQSHYEAENRRLIKEEFAGNSDKCTTMFEDRYDPFCRFVSSCKYTWTDTKDSPDSLKEELLKKCEYREDGSSVSYIYLDDGALRSCTETDASGLHDLTIKYLPGGTKWETTERLYDGNGHLTRMKRYDGDGKLIETRFREYDSGGTFTKETSIDSKGVEHITYLREINSAGQTTRITALSGVTEYTYDDYGNKIKAVITSDSDPGWFHTDEYSYTPVVLTAEQFQTAKSYYQPSIP